MKKRKERSREHIRDKLKAILRDHVGADSAISLRELVSAVEEREVSKLEVYDGCGRDIRDEVSRLIHTEGLPIMSTQAGYFLVKNRADLERCAAMLRSRALSLLAREAKLKKVSLVEVTGQLTLDLVREQESVGAQRAAPTGPIPARYEAITKFLGDPLDQETLHRLQANYGAIFMPRKKLEHIRGAVKGLMELLEEAQG